MGDIRFLDTMTVLTCKPGRRMAKLYTDPMQKPADYDAGGLVLPFTVDLDGLEDLYRNVEDLAAMPERCVVRARVKEAVEAGSWIARRSVDRPDDPAAFEDVPHYWLAVDVDECKTPVDWKKPRRSVKAWRATLPDGLREAGMVWTWSAKAHLSPTVRGRAWFWLDEPHGCAGLRPWAVEHGFDAALYRAVQPHYTAAPVFEGCEDPIAGHRAPMLFEGPDGHIDVDGAIDRARSRRRVSARGGEGSERRAEARRAILEAIGPCDDYPGDKYALCMALGAHARRLGWAPRDVEALVRDWLKDGE